MWSFLTWSDSFAHFMLQPHRQFSSGAGNGNELVGGGSVLRNVPGQKDKSGIWMCSGLLSPCCAGWWLLLHFSKMNPSFPLPRGEFMAAGVESFYSHRKPGVYELEVTLF